MMRPDDWGYIYLVLAIAVIVLAFLSASKANAAKHFKEAAEHWNKRNTDTTEALAAERRRTHTLETDNRNLRTTVQDQADHITKLRTELFAIQADRNMYQKALEEIQTYKAEPVETPDTITLDFTVGLLPTIWSHPEAVARERIEALMFQGIAEQIKPHIQFSDVIYTPFELPKIIGTLTIVDKGESTYDIKKN